LTLEVNDGSDSLAYAMTIDVYDIACLAAIGAGTDELDPGDINGDCFSNLKDFTILAAAWLVDYPITGPVDKP
jgi:hypothetical protein